MGSPIKDGLHGFICLKKCCQFLDFAELIKSNFVVQHLQKFDREPATPRTALQLSPFTIPSDS